MLKTIITSKTTGKSVSTGVVRYTFIVKDNTGKVYSDEDNIVTELSKVPSSQPDNPSEPTQPTDNPSNQALSLKSSVIAIKALTLIFTRMNTAV